MSHATYKPYAPVSDIISKLKSCGIILDDSHANNLLTFKNYYRFSPYIKSIPKSVNAPKTLSLEYIESCYKFDKKLRNILSDSTESIENFARNDITEYFGKTNKHFYSDFLNPTGVDINTFTQDKLACKINKTFNKSDFSGLVFLRDSRGCTLETIPVWVLVESLEFGTTLWILQEIINFENSNKKRDFYKLIKSKYDLTPNEYLVCLKSCKSLRNICAHGHRIYRNSLTGHKPKIPPTWGIESNGRGLTANSTSGLFRKLLGLKVFYKNRQPAWNEFLDVIYNHFENNNHIVHISDYEIPENWIEILKKKW